MTQIIIDRNTVNEFGGEAALEARVAAFHDAMVAHSQTEDQPAPVEHPFVVSIVQAGGWSLVEIREPPASFQETPTGHRPMDPPPFLPRGILSLAEFRIAACAVIDYNAELERLKYITPGSGQALEYRETEAEARLWQTGDDLDKYPFLKAEVAAVQDAHGVQVSPETLVEGVLLQWLQWQQVGAAIKYWRRLRKMRIDLMDNEDEIVKVTEESGWEPKS